MAEVEVLLERTTRQQQEHLGAHLELVGRRGLTAWPTTSRVLILCFLQVNLSMQRTAEDHQTHADYLEKWVYITVHYLTVPFGYVHFHRELSCLASGVVGLADSTESRTTTTATSLDSLLSQVRVPPLTLSLPQSVPCVSTAARGDQGRAGGLCTQHQRSPGEQTLHLQRGTYIVA